MEFPCKVVNVSGSPWVITYHVAGSDRTLTVPESAEREIVAEKIYLASAWHPLTASAIVTSDDAWSYRTHPQNTDEVIGVLTVIMGIILAGIFWTQANPLVR